ARVGQPPHRVDHVEGLRVRVDEDDVGAEGGYGGKGVGHVRGFSGYREVRVPVEEHVVTGAGDGTVIDDENSCDRSLLHQHPRSEISSFTQTSTAPGRLGIVRLIRSWSDKTNFRQKKCSVVSAGDLSMSASGKNRHVSQPE